MTDVGLPSARPGGDTLWDDWDRPPRVPDSPLLHLDGFDGPMDLLLDLAERQLIDFGRVSILQLAEQFIAGQTSLAAHVPLERRADWLVVATRLVLLRSRLLFAATAADAAEAERDAKRQAASLEELLLLRRAAGWLATRPQLGTEVFARPAGRSARISSYMALMDACLFVLRGRDGQPGTEAESIVTLTSAPFRIDVALMRIRALLAREGAVAFPKCLPPFGCGAIRDEQLARAAVASSFAAVLELTRQGVVVVEQAELLGSCLHVLPGLDVRAQQR